MMPNSSKPANPLKNAKIFDDIYTKIISGMIRTSDDLHRAKIQLCKDHKLSKVPSNTEILGCAPKGVYELVLPLLKLKPMRTRSGVAPVAVMTSPEACPHGRCSYCPGGVESGTAQSYTGHEPAALRAAAHSFGPYHQTHERISQLEAIGHPTDKIDLIIMGGTFTTRAEDYQYWFIKRCFDALNRSDSPTLVEAHTANEQARHRCIGMTIETRPDACSASQVARILKLGGTRVELGVQTLDDDVLSNVKRGHGSAETRAATQLLKDAGLKVCYHIMPNLPGMTPAGDLEMFERLFEHAEYRPDMIKIYPTLVVQGTELFESWQRHEYEPYSLNDTIDIIANLKRMLPSWVRIQRVQRDIPAKLISAGVKYSNLRQLVQERLAERGERCNCIRCREIGLNLEDRYESAEENLLLVTEEYDSAGGEEAFISIEDKINDLLIAFARLRLPGVDRLEELEQPAVPETSGRFAFIRELKVFGQLVSFEDPAKKKAPDNAGGSNNSLKWQHKGYGRVLMDAAEEHAKDKWDTHSILVNSGVGARQYYTKLGFVPHGHYMAKFHSS